MKEMNLAYCELTSLLILNGKGKAPEDITETADRVGEWVVRAVRGEVRARCN